MQKPPRIKIPSSVKAGELIEVKTLATHVMETGNRKDPAGKIDSARYHSHASPRPSRASEVFSATLGSGIAANPYIAFFLKVPGPGTLELTWLDDHGIKTVERVALDVA